jgi:adenosylcobinamide kinase/adenosylcobinamide-phosphate guanylyltransferase
VPSTWIVTAQASDEEMAARIAAHRARRPADCMVIEEPLHLANALERIPAGGGLVVIDCLTIWVANLLKAGSALMQDEQESFLNIIKLQEWNLIVVSNEVGAGIVPVNALARQYRDELGRLNQRVAAIADRVLLMVAGIPLLVKGKDHVRH